MEFDLHKKIQGNIANKRLPADPGEIPTLGMHPELPKISKRTTEKRLGWPDKERSEKAVLKILQDEPQPGRLTAQERSLIQNNPNHSIVSILSIVLKYYLHIWNKD